jgi:hypothetical protein
MLSAVADFDRIDQKLHRIADDLRRLIDKAEAGEDIDPFAVTVIACQALAQAEMLKKQLFA